RTAAPSLVPAFPDSVFPRSQTPFGNEERKSPTARRPTLMIERIITFSIRNRSLVIVAGLLLAVWGIYAVYHTPMDAIPDSSENQVIVFTDWAGHSPREIEDQVTYPLTLQLQGLGGVRVIRSSSDFGFSMISMIFEPGLDYHFARQQVQERLNQPGN